MALHVSNVQRIQYAIEPNGSLGVDIAAASMYDLPADEGSVEITLDEPSDTSGALRQYRDDHQIELPMQRTAKAVFTLPMHLPTPCVASSAPTANAFMSLLGAYLGGKSEAVSDTVNDASATAGSFVVTTIARWTAGCALAWRDANGYMHVREVAGVNTGTSTVYLKQALPAAPANGNAIYRSTTYYLDNNISTNVTSIQLRVMGLDPGADENQWKLYAGQITEPPVLDISNGAYPNMKWTINFASWDYDDEDYDITDGPVDYGSVVQILNQDSYLRAYALDTANPLTPIANGSILSSPSYSFELGAKYIPLSTPHGYGNVGAYVMSGDHPKISGSFAIPMESDDWFDHKHDQDDIAVSLQIGSSYANGCILITAPTAQVTNWGRKDLDGIMGEELQWKGRKDEATSEATESKLGISAFRIHIIHGVIEA